jgi:hypothetical protein
MNISSFSPSPSGLKNPDEKTAPSAGPWVSGSASGSGGGGGGGGGGRGATGGGGGGGSGSGVPAQAPRITMTNNPEITGNNFFMRTPLQKQHQFGSITKRHTALLLFRNSTHKQPGLFQNPVNFGQIPGKIDQKPDFSIKPGEAVTKLKFRTASTYNFGYIYHLVKGATDGFADYITP